MRKHEGVVFIFTVIIFFVAFFGANAILIKIDSLVTRKGYVESVENGIVKIIDTTGTIWKWEEEEEDFNKWDNVKMLIDNNNTTTTEKDDIILKIKLDK